MKRALITGITGQDGSYLTEILLEKGYEVHGIVRKSSSFNTQRIDHLYIDPHENPRLRLHYADLHDGSTLRAVLKHVEPVEIYHLGAQSHVRVSFDMPEYTGDVTGLGTTRLLEAVREICPKARFYQASSSEIFGSSPPPQNEETPFHPRSPYGAAKAYAFFMAQNYREAYGLHVSNGILFNHESVRRLPTFVTRKITHGLSRIRYKLQGKLYLGNLEAKRDWGHARDSTRAMYLMLQQDEPGDYVIATGESRSVKDLLELASELAQVPIDRHVTIDERYLRPAEVLHLEGDASKARKILGWEPEVSFEALIKEMVEHDLRLALTEAQSKHTKVVSDFADTIAELIRLQSPHG